MKIGAQASLGLLLPTSAFASIKRPEPPPRILRFHNIHTGERLEACYYSQGCYQTDALKKIDHILRDHYSGKVRHIHRGLLDLLASISHSIGEGVQFDVISGYRSPETNAMLRRKTRGVAKNSLHIQGMAADIRVPGYNTKKLRSICMKQHGGWVGYYPKSNFVHVDVGRVRYW